MIIMVLKSNERTDVPDILNPIRIVLDRSFMRTVKKQSNHEIIVVSNVLINGVRTIES